MVQLVALAIIEMMGKPKEHIEKTLKMYVEKLKKDKPKFKILSEDFAKAEPKENYFVSFVELKIQFPDVSDVVWFCFDYMPASIEILEPDDLIYDSRDFGHFLNDLQVKHHQINLIVKELRAQNQILKKNGTTLMRNLIRAGLKIKPMDTKQIAKFAGAPEKTVEKFANVLVKEGKIKKEGNLYSE